LVRILIERSPIFVLIVGCAEGMRGRSVVVLQGYGLPVEEACRTTAVVTGSCMKGSVVSTIAPYSVQGLLPDVNPGHE
jgi:hypothetical protein